MTCGGGDGDGGGRGMAGELGWLFEVGRENWRWRCGFCTVSKIENRVGRWGLIFGTHLSFMILSLRDFIYSFLFLNHFIHSLFPLFLEPPLPFLSPRLLHRYISNLIQIRNFDHFFNFEHLNYVRVYLSHNEK